MQTAWKLLKKQIVFDRFMQIEERVYQLPDGAIKNYYIKINQPSVCVLALTNQQQVITVEQFRPGPEAILNELPGGFADKSEEPEAAAKRELLEETGYAGTVEFVTKCYDDAYANIVRYCFVATNCRKMGKQNLDSSEFINVKLIDLAAFLKLVRAGLMTDVEVALLGLDHLKLL